MPSSALEDCTGPNAESMHGLNEQGYGASSRYTISVIFGKRQSQWFAKHGVIPSGLASWFNRAKKSVNNVPERLLVESPESDQV